jgi:hypothetical protein
MLKSIKGWLWSSGPTWHYRRIWLDALVATAVINLVASMLFWSIGFSVHEIFLEDGPIEDLQSLSLAFAAVVAGIAALRLSILARYVAITTACIAAIFFMREMPICRADTSFFCVSKMMLPITIAVIASLLLIATALFELRHRGGMLRAIHPRLSWPLAFTAIVLGASQVAEKLDIVFAEELLESYGFMVLVMSAIWLFRFSRRQGAVPVEGVRKAVSAR